MALGNGQRIVQYQAAWRVLGVTEQLGEAVKEAVDGFGSGRATHGSLDHSRLLFPVALHNETKQTLLALEREVEAGRGDPHRFRQVAHRSGVVAFAPKQ